MESRATSREHLYERPFICTALKTCTQPYHDRLEAALDLPHRPLTQRWLNHLPGRALPPGAVPAEAQPADWSAAGSELLFSPERLGDVFRLSQEHRRAAPSRLSTGEPVFYMRDNGISTDPAQAGQRFQVFQ